MIFECEILPIYLFYSKEKKFSSKNLKTLDISGAPGGIRTPDPLIRSQVLYPTEPRAHKRPTVYIKVFISFQDFLFWNICFYA